MKHLWLLPIVQIAACTKGVSNDGDESEGECQVDTTQCAGSTFQTCADGAWVDDSKCAQECDDDLGCVECLADQTMCSGLNVIGCNGDGTWGGSVTACSPNNGDTCLNGACINACEAAAQTDSYLGCEYWPTVTLNAQLGTFGGSFDFAVAVGNPNSVTVSVSVEQDKEIVAMEDIAPNDVATITLPWVTNLVQRPAQGWSGAERSVLVEDGAYRLYSTLPVSAYQFSPLQFDGGGCDPDAFGNTPCSYSNDASLLLPTTGLDSEYVAISRPTFSVDGLAIAGFISIVGTENNTSVMVRFSAHTQASASLPAYAPGESDTFYLDRGDVLQLVSALAFEEEECSSTNGNACLGGTDAEACVGGADYDLTGTYIQASEAIAVFGGHNCSFVPYNRWACDHLEEQIFPLSAWGTSIIAASTEPQAAGEPNLWKVVSGRNDNTITFDPPFKDEQALDQGESIEFAYAGAFQATSTSGDRIAVAQFMVGEDYEGVFCDPVVGDPSMGLAVPFEQFRTGYDFLTPTTYTKSYVNVIAPLDNLPVLDGASLPPLMAIGSTGYGYVRVEINPGAHHIESLIDPEPFGITVSGIASYTSYLFPGGLDLETLPID